MNKKLLACAFLGIAAVACSDSSTVPTQPIASGAPAGDVVANGTNTHVMKMVGAQASDPITNAGPILYHGGPILTQTKVAAMYWGTSTIYTGGPTPGTTGTGAGDGSLVGYFLNHFGGSPYFNINTTYTDTQGGGHTVQNSVTYTQFWANNVNVPPANGSNVSNATISAEIIRGFTTGAWTYDPATVYLVFTNGNTNLGGGFGTSYCAYHGNFQYLGQMVIYAAQPYVNQFPTACSLGFASPNNDLAADRVINVVAHEVEEATTDYALNAWFDNSGAENADKCAWTFGTTYNNGTGIANMLLGAKDFLIQQNWIQVPGAGSCAVSFGAVNQPPVANFTYSCTVARVCTFTSTSTDPDGTVVAWLWTNVAGTKTISTASSFTKTFNKAMSFSAKLTVTDNGGATNSITLPIVVP